jgi:hypothetical protein
MMSILEEFYSAPILQKFSMVLILAKVLLSGCLETKIVKLHHNTDMSVLYMITVFLEF